MNIALTGAFIAAAVYLHRRLSAIDADLTQTHGVIDGHARGQQILAADVVTLDQRTNTIAEHLQWTSARSELTAKRVFADRQITDSGVPS
jgi:uncharacterized protein YoxC